MSMPHFYIPTTTRFFQQQQQQDFLFYISIVQLYGEFYRYIQGEEE